MRKQRVLTDYVRYSDEALSTVSGKSSTALTANVNFPNLPIAEADYTALVTDFKTKHEAAARTGGKLEITAKNNSRLVLLEAMKQQAFHVNVVANGNANVLVSSGFTLAAQPQSLMAPEVPLWLTLSDGRQMGQIRLDFEPIKGAWEYEFQVSTELSTDGQVIWSETKTTRVSRGNVIAPVTPGLTYWVRVRARNGSGLGDWTHVLSIIAR